MVFRGYLIVFISDLFLFFIDFLFFFLYLPLILSVMDLQHKFVQNQTCATSWKSVTRCFVDWLSETTTSDCLPKILQSMMPRVC